ncbi:putative papain-like cysteine peptidase superfamily [Helianthus annuus]|nr:putative papain-like cysteine peptidase superfamily [Helianthus annuus]
MQKTIWIFSPQVDCMLTLETDRTCSRVSAFECGLKTNLSGRHHLVDLHDFDMVFVPVLEVDHYYLVVFDLEDERIYLIDHLGDRGSGVLLRDNETYILRQHHLKWYVIHVYFCYYLCCFSPFLYKQCLRLFSFTGTQKEIFVDYLKLVNHPKGIARSRERTFHGLQPKEMRHRLWTPAYSQCAIWNSLWVPGETSSVALVCTRRGRKPSATTYGKGMLPRYSCPP